MSQSVLEELLSGVGPLIQKISTQMREPIFVSERLCVTIRYLVTGDAQATIATNDRMSPAVCRVNYRRNLQSYLADTVI